MSCAGRPGGAVLVYHAGERTMPSPASPVEDDHRLLMPRGDVLVVDDDGDGRDALSQLLTAHGYTVRQAHNGRVALDMIAERVPGLLVLDLEMPVMNGWDVLESLDRAGARQSIAILVVSAGASPPPGVAFIRKPCEVDELLSMVTTVTHPYRTGASSERHP